MTVLIFLAFMTLYSIRKMPKQHRLLFSLTNLRHSKNTHPCLNSPKLRQFCVSMKRYYGSVDFDVAVNIYGEVAKVDPFNLDNMDTYSNILYVKVCTTSDDDVMK